MMCPTMIKMNTFSKEPNSLRSSRFARAHFVRLAIMSLTTNKANEVSPSEARMSVSEFVFELEGKLVRKQVQDQSSMNGSTIVSGGFCFGIK